MKIDLEPTIKAAENANPEAPVDYRDPVTGLLMCGACHTGKETRVTIFDTEQVVRCQCKCAVEREKAEQRALKDAERQRVIRIRREKCFGNGIRKAAFTFDADDGSDPKTMQRAKGYVKLFEEMRAKGKGLLFLGGTGTGKTFAACCIANALLDKGYSVRVATFAEIAAKLQGNWDKEEIYKELARYDLLVLDDLGAERDTSYMDEIVYTVVDIRSAAKKPIIVTSNMDAHEFTQCGEIGKERVYSRISEMCTPVTVTGPDRRRERMKQETAADLEMLLQAGK